LFTLTAADAAAVFAVMAGPGAPGPMEPIFNLPVRSRYALPARPRVGILQDPPILSASYRQLYTASCRHLTTLQCEHGFFDFAPFAEVGTLLYEGPWAAERYAVVGALIESGVSGIDPVVAEVIRAGMRFSAVEAFHALYRVRELEVQMRKTWDEFDVLMVPTASNLPMTADVSAEPVLCNNELGTYTNFVNLLRLSAMAVPFSFTDDGLPFGVTFIAPGGCDWALIELAAQWQHSRALSLGANLRELQEEDTFIVGTPPGSMPLAVVGAHLSGMPLYPQLIAMGARLRAVTSTSARYRLYALHGTIPSKPGLVRSDDGARIAVEVYDVPVTEIGRFLAGIATPLGLGSIELQDGTWVTGFICEPWALLEAQDITAYGGWRSYLSTGVRH
jgi:allophanate hydrolase